MYICTFTYPPAPPLPPPPPCLPPSDTLSEYNVCRDEAKMSSHCPKTKEN